MTGNKRRLSLAAISRSLGGSKLSLELRKSSTGAVAVISDVVSISEYDDENIVLLTHGGRLAVQGERLSISSLEGRTLEIYGRITEVRLVYGKA